MHFKNGKLILILMVLCSTISLAQEHSAWPDDYPVKLESVGFEASYDTLFKAQNKGWLGSDAAHSIVLSENRILWLFGDTFLGEVREGKRYPEGPHINNCIAIEDRSESIPGVIQYHWREAEGKPESFFPPAEGMPGKYYWPTNGIVVKDRLLLFCYTMSADDTNWWIAGTVIIAVDNYDDDPSLWSSKYYDLKLGDNNFGIHSGLILEGEFLYFLGYKDFRHGRSAILGRTDQKEFSANPRADLIEIWTDGWFSDRWDSVGDKPVALFSPGITETDIQYIPDWGMYAVTTYDPMEADILLTVSESLTGPWTEPVHIFTNPDHVTMTYAARPHPQISSRAGEVIISYVTSPRSLDIPKETLDTYRPRFLRILLSKN